MADQEASGSPSHHRRSPEERTTFFQRLIRELFPTPEEKWERKKRRRRRRNPIKEYFDRLQKRRAYNRYQRRERKRRRKHSKTMLREERKKKVRTYPFQQFFKRNFTRETKPYYYYAETDQPRSEIQRQRKRLLHFAINSTVIYLITYFITYLTYQVAVMFVASRFGLNTVLFFYEVSFPAGNNSSLWSSFNIILITFSGPFMSVLLGTYYLFMYARKERTKGLSKLFYLWIAFHSLNFFLGAFPAGVITNQGFGYVIGWLYLPTFIRFGLSIVFLFALGLIGFYNTQHFLESSNSIYWTQPAKRQWLVLLGGIIPWVMSAIILFILKYPLIIPQHENIVQYDTILYMTMVFFIAPMLVNMQAKPNFDANVRKTKGRRINWIYVIVLVLMMVAFRAGLDTGFSYFVFK
jgi:hypothetical protein